MIKGINRAPGRVPQLWPAADTCLLQVLCRAWAAAREMGVSVGQWS